MRLLTLLTLFLVAVYASPVEKRSTTKVYGNKVAVVSGIIINAQIAQCFHNSGVDIAKAYAAAIADQWDNYQNTHGGTSWISAVEAQWATSNTAHLYCSTFDAVFTFGTSFSANLFAGWVKRQMGNTKRDDVPFALGDLVPAVYVAGVDLPHDHAYFGTNGTVSTTLQKRSWKSCSNNQCGFSFTNDQTGICRDTTFPAGHQYNC